MNSEKNVAQLVLKVCISMAFLFVFLTIATSPVISYFKMRMENGMDPSSPSILPYIWAEDFSQASNIVRVVTSLNRLHSKCEDTTPGIKRVIFDRIEDGVKFEFVIYGIEACEKTLNSESFDQAQQKKPTRTLKWLKQLAVDQKARLYFMSVPSPTDFYIIDHERVFIVESENKKVTKRQKYSRSNSNPIVARKLVRKFKEFRSKSTPYLL